MRTSPPAQASSVARHTDTASSTPYRVTAVLCAVPCALAPAYTIRWHLGFYPTTLLEAAIVLTIVAFVVESRSNRQSIRLHSPLALPALIFLIAGAISVVSAPSVRAALGLYRAYLVEPVAFGLVLVNVIRTPSRALLVVAGLMVGAAVAGLANSVVVAAGLLNHTYVVTESPPVVIYMTANAVALYTVPLMAIAGALALHGRGLQRVVGLSYLPVGLVVAVLSFSRGGYLALAAVALGLALSHRRRLILLAVMAVLGAGVALLPPVRLRVLIETQNVYGNTVSSRLDLWSGAVELIRHRPLLGAGLAGFPQRVAPYFTHLHTPANFNDPHNIVLNFWVETGLLGLIAIGWIMVAAFRVSIEGWRTGDSRWRPYHLGVILALVAVLVHGLVDVPYFKNDLSLEFWTLLAITWAGREWTRAATSRKGLPQQPSRSS
jgi:O-antigen ligase